MIKIAPSILSADFSNLKDQIEKIENSGEKIIHIDVMDGHFVPNMSFGFPIVEAIRKLTAITLDVHLMIENPDLYVEKFIQAGADIVTIHYEADIHIDRTIKLVKSYGVQVGVAINPATNLDNIKYIIDEIDMVLIMTVNPGFGGQHFIDYCENKVKELRSYNSKIIIEVDGGITTDNINKLKNAGANIFVVGSSAFKQGKIEENIKSLRKSCM